MKSSANGGGGGGAVMPSTTAVAPSALAALPKGVKDVVAGTVTGIALTVTGHPLDTIKVRLQVAPTAYRGMWDCAVQTGRVEGVRGFFRGLSSPLSAAGATCAVQMFVYARAQEMLLKLNGPSAINNSFGGPLRLSTGGYFIAGALTAFVEGVVYSPVSLLKNQMQSQIFRSQPAAVAAAATAGAAAGTPLLLRPYRASSMASTVKSIVQTNGFGGLWHGVSISVLRTIPCSGLYFGTYEWLRDRFARTQRIRVSELSGASLLLAGGLAGINYWLIPYPLDTLRSAIQSDSLIRSERKYASIADCARQLYRSGGWARFYVGFAPCMIRAIPANACGFLAYEKTKLYLKY